MQERERPVHSRRLLVPLHESGTAPSVLLQCLAKQEPHRFGARALGPDRCGLNRVDTVGRQQRASVAESSFHRRHRDASRYFYPVGSGSSAYSDTVYLKSLGFSGVRSICGRSAGGARMRAGRGRGFGRLDSRLGGSGTLWPDAWVATRLGGGRIWGGEPGSLVGISWVCRETTGLHSISDRSRY